MKSEQETSRRYGGKSAEERQAQRRRMLLDAGFGIWQEQGWAAVTMRGVCARSGLTDRYFYESFRDRDALLAALWDEMRDETLGRLAEVIEANAEEAPLVQLHHAIHAVVHHIGDDPSRATILFGDHGGSAVLQERRRDTVQLSTDLLIALAKPFLRTDTDEQAFRVTVLVGIGGFVELMLAWRSGLVDGDADAMVAHLQGVGEALAPRFLDG